MQLFHAQSTTDLAAALTTLVWVDQSYPTADGTTVTINGAGNLSINAAGAYLIQVYSRAWTLPAAAGSAVEYSVSVISGSAGRWSSETAVTKLASGPILRVEEQTGSADASGHPEPDIAAVALWQTGNTFPAVVRVQAAFNVDGVPTATAVPVFKLGVTRLGDAFE